jgi:iron complex outermembrane receptor protein
MEGIMQVAMRTFLFAFGVLASAVMVPTAAAANPSNNVVPDSDVHRLSGRVTDSAGATVPQVQVTIIEAQRTVRTGPDGRYLFSDVPAGTYRISFSAIGYAPEVRRMTLGNDDVSLDVALRKSLVELPTVQVTASPAATTALESPQPTSVVGGQDLARAQAPSLGETLNDVPGVHSFSTGSGIGKPVIRGLTSNRVLVLDNGQRMETQQWGDEHSPNVESANADRIEVIRGPASVLYGSDALGGVINVLQPDLLDAIGRTPIMRGRASLGYLSNNREPDGALMAEGASGGFGFRVEGSGRTSQDVRTPTYRLWNSGLRQVGGAGTVGYRSSWGSISGTYSQRNEKLFMTDEDPTATPTQRMVTNRASLDVRLPFRDSRLDIKTGWERSRRREFEDSVTDVVGLGLLAKTWTGSVQYHHPAFGKLYGILGASGLHSGFDKFGEETLIPNNRVSSGGVFAFEQTDLGRWKLSMGARYDHRHLDVDQDDELGVTAQTRTYNSFVGNLGALYRLSEPVALVLNVGRGYRAPNPFELFANGVHEGTVAFEHGNPDLHNETSINTDFAVRMQSRRASVEIGTFANVIQNFIYSIPTGQTDPESGFEIFDFVQGNARLFGFEGSVDYHPMSLLHLHGGADYTYGQNVTAAQPLPEMPPFRATYSVRLEPESRGILQTPYVYVGGESNAKQGRLNSAEAEFYAAAFDGAGYRPVGYTLANAGAGFTLNASARPVRFDFMVRNLFNEAYADYLSRIKTNAPLPGMGRTFVTRVTVEL